jgi:hypothetical protein
VLLRLPKVPWKAPPPPPLACGGDARLADLVRGLLAYDQRARLSAREAGAHAFFQAKRKRGGVEEGERARGGPARTEAGIFAE